MDISVIVPLFNEEESLPELAAWIKRVMDEHNFSYEVIMVDDGSNDHSWKVVESLSEGNPAIKGIKFRRNYGKSAALYKGFKIAAGDVVITMDADLQDSPDEIPELYRMIMEENYDLVSGWKKRRYDPISKTLPSKFFNWTARRVTHIKLHDFNCGLKAYKNTVVKSIEVFGEMHRYIPVMVKKAGFTRIGEKVVQHRKRKYGVSKFGLERFVHGYLDMLTISFISKFGKSPMHFFGVLGTLMFILGFFAVLYIGIDKWYCLQHHIKALLIAQTPYFYLSLTAMILGTQLFLAGFLGELITRNSSDRNAYLVEKEIL
ncbi:MAG: glycosyltransferase family 2 protein [Bacteroidota bacterium]|nr:glycosyltransferase family 2 protein [Bacteroidota bacterium]MDP4225684.1 glycosyltransferase family 2 protein [Bacteroidota bacterium]MDP4274548.1 glycosyltransferase family 2 protein [Bacteroidota bacterium]